MYRFLELALVLLLMPPLLFGVYKFVLWRLDAWFSPRPEKLVEDLEQAKSQITRKRQENEELARQLKEANKELDELTGSRPKSHRRM